MRLRNARRRSRGDGGRWATSRSAPQDGAIELAWITGAVDARTGEGNVAASHLDGRIELRADSGEIALRDVRGQIAAKTESGAVYASFLADPSGVIETQRGSVEVSLPASAKLALDARSGRGRVEIGAGLALDGSRARRPHDRHAERRRRDAAHLHRARQRARGATLMEDPR